MLHGPTTERVTGRPDELETPNVTVAPLARPWVEPTGHGPAAPAGFRVMTSALSG